MRQAQRPRRAAAGADWRPAAGADATTATDGNARALVPALGGGPLPLDRSAARVRGSADAVGAVRAPLYCGYLYPYSTYAVPYEPRRRVESASTVVPATSDVRTGLFVFI